MGADLRRVEDRLHDETRVNYPFIGEILSELIAGGGKRLRPLILLLAARPFDYDLERLLPAAAGVELLHTASLIHDDTIDHAELRRGRPTLNSLISTETVILFGDYIFARAAILAAATMNPRVVGVFANTLGEICDGELQQIFTTRQLEQSREDYLRRIFGKTAALFAGSAEMGAILGEAPPESVVALRRFGADVGMAFQIIDDVLDLRENTAHLGKPSGLDLRQGTITLPTLIFVEQADSEGRALAQRVIDGRASEPEQEELISAIRASGALTTALDEAECYITGALTALESIPDGEPRRMLTALAEHSLSRTH